MTKDIFRHYTGTVRLQVSATSDLPRGDGLEQKLDGGAGFGLEVLTILQALADKHRMCEDHDGSQDQFRGCAGVNRLEVAGLDPIPQDQFNDVAKGVLVCPDTVTVKLDCDQHDVIDALL